MKGISKETQLQRALQEVHRLKQTGLKVHQAILAAEKKIGDPTITYNSVSNRYRKAMKGGNVHGKTTHGNQALTLAEEGMLVGVMRAYAAAGTPLAPAEVIRTAQEQFPATRKGGGWGWYAGFVKRNKSELSKRAVKQISKARAAAETVPLVEDFLQYLALVSETVSADPRAWNNVDEILISAHNGRLYRERLVGPGTRPTLKTKRLRTVGGITSFVSAAGENIMTVIVLKATEVVAEKKPAQAEKVTDEAAAADDDDEDGAGDATPAQDHDEANGDQNEDEDVQLVPDEPPATLHKLVLQLPEALQPTRANRRNVFYAVNKSGRVTKGLWRNVLRQYVTVMEREQPGLRTALLADNLSAHRDVGALLAVVAAGHELIFFPPNCTHFMQPLDDIPFGQWKQRFTDFIIAFGWQENDVKDLSDDKLLRLAMRALDVAMTKDVIKAGWRNVGLHPFDADAIRRRAAENVGKAPPATDWFVQQAQQVAAATIKANKPAAEKPKDNRTLAVKLPRDQLFLASAVVEAAKRTAKEDKEKLEAKEQEKGEKEKEQIERKRKKEEQKEENERKKKQKKEEQVTRQCRVCEKVWRGGRNWRWCETCDAYAVCPLCHLERDLSKNEHSIMIGHEEGCGVQK